MRTAARRKPAAEMPRTPTSDYGQEFKAVCQASDLRGALFLANMVCEKRTTIPLLAHVRLAVSDGVLSVNATDQDNEICSTLAADSGGTGSIMVPAIEMLKIVSRLAGPIELAMRPGDIQLSIQSERTAFAVSGMRADGYGQLFVAAETAQEFTIGADECRRMIAKTSYSISSEETRYSLNGLHLWKRTGVLVAESTDGHRLGRVETPAPTGMDNAINTIIPRKTVRLLTAMVSKGDDPISFTFSDGAKQGAFRRGHVTLFAKMIDGTFPDTGRVIPAANDKIVTLETKELASLLNRVTAICSRDDITVRLTLTPSLLHAKVNSMLWGSATEEMAVSYVGPPLEVGFNRRYLGDILRASGDQTVIAFLDAQSPVLVSDPLDVGAFHVLMPMRL